MSTTLAIRNDADHLIESLIAINIDLQSRTELREYLNGHHDVTALIEPICVRLREVFGPITQLSLQVYDGLEVSDRYLALYVRPCEYDPDLIDRIESVSSEFASQLDDADEYLLITTDFRRPQV